MPYYACNQCDVLVQKGEQPEHCPVCDEDTGFRPTWNVNQ